MSPMGLTMKRGRNKYQPEARGELMLIHECAECKALSINRIAADDDPETIIKVFQKSLMLGQEFHAMCHEYEIVVLNAQDTQTVYTQLYGRSVAIWALT